MTASPHASSELPVCILGMHRSGTSLTARILNLLGVDLGPEEGLIGSSPQNRKGYWEQRAIFELNETVLAAMGGDWATPPPLEPGWERGAELEPLRRRARQLIDGHFGQSPLWGFKDPRISLTLPFWRTVVPEMRYVICIRNPDEVRESFQRYSREDGFAQRDWDDLWLLSTASALVGTGAGPRLLVRYEDYFVELREVVERVADFVGRGLPPSTFGEIESFLESGLRHHRRDPAEFLADESRPEALRELYAAVCALPTGASGESLRPLERLAARLLADHRRTLDRPATAATMLASFPDDLEQPGVRRFGIYPDGWLEGESYVQLAPAHDGVLVLRALVPPVEAQHLELTVDGQLLASMPAAPGILELRQPLPESDRPLSIGLTWRKTAPIGDDDEREGAARLELLAAVPTHPPTAIKRFPDDVALPDAAAVGIYEDGWLHPACRFQLAGGEGAELVLRAEVPPRKQGQHLELLVDGRRLMKGPVDAGPLELSVPLEASSRRRQIELRWGGTISLAAPDTREAAARLTYAGLE